MDAASTVETHVSRLVFGPDTVRKYKKSVEFPFLDARRVEDRRDLCVREVELNRRFSPDVYLDVEEILDDAGALEDSCVVMRRMPADRRLSSLAKAGEPLDACIRAVARVVARVHAESPHGPEIDACATMEALRELWHGNVEQMQEFVPRLVAAQDLDAIALAADRYLSGRGELLDERISRGLIVDGHGDLIADDIFCLDDGPRVLDCLEFDDRLRRGDVLYDTAFLAMDLERCGRPDLASRFMADYRELSAEEHPSSLEHHYIAYRALVRAKVACFRGDAAAVARDISLCRRHLGMAVPRLVVVGGLPGTGKTTLARAIGSLLGCAVLRSDVVRKELVGIGSADRAAADYRCGIYAPQVSDATYELMLDRATVLLLHGESVILDASFSASKWRHACTRIARATSSDLLQLRCTAPTAIAAERLVRRNDRGVDASDADEAIALRIAADFDEWPDAVEIETTEPAERLAARLTKDLGRPLGELV